MVDIGSEDELRAHLKLRIKEALDDCALKGERFAEAMGVSKAAASKWGLTGKITHYNLYRLARISRKPVGWFYPDYERGDDSGAMRDMLEAHSDDAAALEDALLEVLSARKRLSNIK